MNYQYQNGVDKAAGWVKHLPSVTQEVNENHLQRFFNLMYERQEIWYRRFILKQPKPWTQDTYLQMYKFTNVYRELDRASQWLIKNVLLDHSLTIEDLIFRILIFRFYNQPNTFEHPVYFVNLPHYKFFNTDQIWRETVTYRQKVDNPFHISYLMNLAFAKKPIDWKGEGLFKDEAYCTIAFAKVHQHIPEIVQTIQTAKQPEEIIKCLEKLHAVSGFQSYEFYLDFCYVAKYWRYAIMKFDENDYVNVGPGCSLGIRLIFPSLLPNEQKSGIQTLKDLSEQYLKQFGDFKYVHWNRSKQKYEVSDKWNLTLHSGAEFWACEYSKYFKMMIKAGKQRSKFLINTQRMDNV